MKKPNVIFWLKENCDKESDKPALIMLNFSYNGKRLKLSTGLTIKPTNWDDDKDLPKKSFGDYFEYKSKLLEFEEKVLAFYSDSIKNGIIPEPASIRKHLQNKDALVHESDIVSVHTILSEFVEEKTLEVKGLTVKKYATLQNVLLKEYEAAYKCTLTFDSMDLLFEKRFKHFLTSVKKHKNNTVSKYMDCLKVFLKWASKKGYHNNLYHLEFTSKREKTKVVYLEYSELTAILNLKLEDKPKLQKVRDWFCFQCLTGQRFSDIANMKWQDLVTLSDGRLEWHVYQIKGNKQEMVEVPILKRAETILNNLKKAKNNGKVFPKISNQKFNDYLKQVCELAGIISHVNYVTYSGKNQIDLSGPKNKFISSHTARKTFVTVSKYHGNMSNEAIRAITGHANDKMLNVYLGEDKRHVRSEMERAWGNI
jgi:integrase